MKTHALVGAAIIGALAIPATASATEVVDLACVDGHPQATLTHWTNSAPDAHPYTFTVDGVPADSGRLTIVSNPQTLTSTAVLTGEHDLVVSVSRFTVSAHVSCGTPAPPQMLPPVAAQQILPEQTPGGTTTAATAPPGAVARVKKATKAKPKVTCAYLRRVGAGPRTYARYGWTYRCRVILQQRRPTVPAVTG